MELLIGVLGDEGCRYFSQDDVDVMTSSKSPGSLSRDTDDDTRWRRTLRTYVRNNFRFHQQTIYDIIEHNYRDWDDESAASNNDDDRQPTGDGASRRRLASLAALITDGQYVSPTVELAARHSVCGPSPADTFLYTFGLTPETNCGSRRRRQLDLLAYVFGAPLAEGLDPFPPTSADDNDDDRKLAETVMSYWANFIRTGFEIVLLFAFLALLQIIYAKIQ